MSLRDLVVLAVLLCAATASGTAAAWQEAHQAGEDVNVRVEADGVASVHDLLRWRVVRGPVKAIDLVGVDPRATLDPDVTITSEDGRPLTGHLVRADERTVRVLVDQPRALMRGTFTFEARWRIDLVATRALTFDGANWRLAWSAPVAADGIDASRTNFDLPGAPEEPRPILADTGALDETAVATVQRTAGRDSLELVRPHVARGESASWTVRVDPRALPGVGDPLAPPARAAPPPEEDRIHAVVVAVAFAAVGLAFAGLVSHKTASFAAECRTRGATAAGLLPLPAAARALAGGAAFAGAVALELGDRLLEGAALAALAALAATLRAPDVRPSVRGPGKWLALRPEEAFAPPRGPQHWMDAGGMRGRVALAGLAVFAGALGLAARHDSPEGPWIVALDAAALLPLWLTGRAVQLPPTRGDAAASWLRSAFDRLQPVGLLRAVPWGRMVVGRSSIDELRLLVLPRSALPGVAGIEVGLGWIDTPVGWVSSPEVLVRVLDGSPAAARLAQTGPVGRILPGRRPDERVLRALPKTRTPRGTATLVSAFADAMSDRRVQQAPAGPWKAPERRLRVPVYLAPSARLVAAA